MYLLVDFGETKRQNKAKRRAAEIDRAIRTGGIKGDSTVDRYNLARVREKRKQSFVDPLSYRSSLKNDKVIQPYEKVKASTIPLWADKTRGGRERLKIGGILGNEFISTKPSDNEKIREKARTINANKFNKKINSMSKSVTNVPTKPKSGTGGLLLATGLALGGIGSSLYLANRRKKKEVEQ